MLKKHQRLEWNLFLINQFSHLSVWLSLVLQSVIKEKELKLLHVTDLQQINEHIESLMIHNGLQDNIPLLLTQKTISKVLSSSNVKSIQNLKNEYILSIKSFNDLYLKNSAEIQLEGMQDIISTWEKNNNIISDKTRVLIVCTQGPREDLLEKQFFLNHYAKKGVYDVEKKLDISFAWKYFLNK